MNFPRFTAVRISTRKARLGTVAARPAVRMWTSAPDVRAARTRANSRLGLLLLVWSALFFSFLLWV